MGHRSRLHPCLLAPHNAAAMLQNWRELKLGEWDNGFPVVVHYREDVTNMLQELLSHPKVSCSLLAMHVTSDACLEPSRRAPR